MIFSSRFASYQPMVVLRQTLSPLWFNTRSVIGVTTILVLAVLLEQPQPSGRMGQCQGRPPWCGGSRALFESEGVAIGRLLDGSFLTKGLSIDLQVAPGRQDIAHFSRHVLGTRSVAGTRRTILRGRRPTVGTISCDGAIIVQAGMNGNVVLPGKRLNRRFWCVFVLITKPLIPRINAMSSGP